VIGSGVARRYARAAFNIALERQELDDWQRDIALFGQVLADLELVAALESPRLSAKQKDALLSSVYSGTDELRRNFLSLLASRQRLSIIGQIAAEFDRLLDEHRGVAKAEVTTAVLLDDASREVVRSWLAKATGRTIVLEEKVDSNILGGVVARIGDRLLNVSLAEQLAAMRSRLAYA